MEVRLTMKKILIAAAGLIVAAGPLTAIAADGHCNYTQENMFAGPFKVCDMPVTAEQCDERGKTDDNSGAVHGEGACATEGAVGTCDMGDNGLRIYYEGDPGGLEIGCGFQSGEWKSAG